MFLTATKRKLCNQTVDNHANALEYVPDSYKAQKMCYKAVDSNPSAIQFVPECFKTQEMCRKAVNSPSFYYVPYRYKTQKCVLLKCLCSFYAKILPW